jgi:hypothetical protein
LIRLFINTGLAALEGLEENKYVLITDYVGGDLPNVKWNIGKLRSQKHFILETLYNKYG